MMKPEERASKLKAIAQDVIICRACVLYQGRRKAVPGDGAMHADIMFIGEGPGQYEDEQGLPFVGRSGQYLEELLRMIGLHRQEVYITNVVKCRPPNNRDPLPNEIEACKSYLDRQIEVIDPILIATLGRYSMARYFPNGKITQIHGKPKVDNGRIYYPLFHPAAVLRNPDLRPAMEADFRRMADLVKEVKNKPVITEEPETPENPPPAPPKQLSLF